MSAEEMDETARAAELHDVGKVAIPDAILDKPGPLDDEEWEFMRRHTIIGERILGSAPALAPVGKLVRSSHERYDGMGYPDGLMGEQIPLGARVVAVCDAYDAMTSDRSYRVSLSSAEAIEELVRRREPSSTPGWSKRFATYTRRSSSLQPKPKTPRRSGKLPDGSPRLRDRRADRFGSRRTSAPPSRGRAAAVPDWARP